MSERWQAWPEDVRPERAPVYTVNELETEATAEEVWPHLVCAEAWPTFYQNARDVRIETHGARELGPDVVFRWRTFGVPVRTRVIVFEPARALAWRGDEVYGRGMHTWLLVPTARGCRLVTEEVQCGLVPSLGRWWLRPGLLHWHQRWLEGLSARALAHRAA